jgi:DNA repair photolyase
MAPVVPGFTTERRKLEATMKAIADHGAAFLGANVLYLKAGTKDHFMGFLAREFPHMVEGYGRLYAGAYASSEYVQIVRGMIATLQQRHGVDRRPPRGPAELPHEKRTGEERAACEQAAFEWDTAPDSADAQAVAASVE